MNKDADWRNDPGLVSKNVYVRKFALFPKVCGDGTKVWLDNYYVKYVYWGFKGSDFTNNTELHRDKHESITEAEYIVRKLIEGF
jgi:hypothetical protein